MSIVYQTIIYEIRACLSVHCINCSNSSDREERQPLSGIECLINLQNSAYQIFVYLHLFIIIIIIIPVDRPINLSPPAC